MRRLTTGPVHLFGRIGNLSAPPWRLAPPRVVPLSPPNLYKLPCGAEEIVLGQCPNRTSAPEPAARTLLSGRIELPAGGEPVRGRAAVTELERFLDRHGAGGLRSREGEYCLAHLTRDGGTLYLYRGLTTTRGLYYRLCHHGLIFATDPEDLCDPERPLHRQVDVDVLAALAIETPVPDDASWYHGVRRLPAGYLLTAGAGGLRVERHDDLRVAEPARDPFPVAARSFRTLCSAAVARAVADVPTSGIQLSGGLDSAVVAFEAHRHGDTTLFPFHFHYDLPAMADEKAMAEAVARQCGLRLDVLDGTASLAPGGDYLLPGLPARAPLTHGFVLPNLASCEALAARPGPRRLLSGVGGDELQLHDFMTPLRSFGRRALNPLAAGAPPWQLFDNAVIRQFLGRSLKEPAPASWAGRAFAAARVLRGTAPMRRTPFDPSLVEGVPWFTAEAISAARGVGESAMAGYADGFARARAGVRRTWLEMYLTYVNFHRNANDYTMATWQHAVFDAQGIEYVAPLVDRALAEFSLTLDTRYRYVVHRGHPVSKPLMRAGYTGLLPRALLARLDKVDYSSPYETFVLNNKSLVGDLLGADSRLAELGLLAPHAVRRLLNAPTWQLRRKAGELVHTASLELWLRGGDRRPNEPIPAVEPPPATRRTSPAPVAKPAVAALPAAGDAAWRMTPDAVVRFLPDEAVLLNEREFKLYRLDADGADLLGEVLRCGCWARLEAALRNGDHATTAKRLDRARELIGSLIHAGLLDGPLPRRNTGDHDRSVETGRTG
ncbi:asparagine synthase-related protein [Amycolatopsis anabasis]|uniref:asparagine synthase-related protein n=1 Tax=Amycolatopsis anabasis TaxID=1840409 RepID=UPI00131E1835|nr:asparagine synthase-related protein [Amycolatopsis anabasis]